MRLLAQHDNEGQYVALLERNGLAMFHALAIQKGAICACIAREHRLAVDCQADVPGADPAV